MRKFYWKSTCSSCRAARVAVRAIDDTIDERNFSKDPLTAAEIEDLVDRAGGVAPILSSRTAGARERGWTVDRPPEREAFVAAAAGDNNLVRRPILVVGDQIVVGADLPALRRALS